LLICLTLETIFMLPATLSLTPQVNMHRILNDSLLHITCLKWCNVQIFLLPWGWDAPVMNYFVYRSNSWKHIYGMLHVVWSRRDIWGANYVCFLAWCPVNSLYFSVLFWDNLVWFKCYFHAVWHLFEFDTTCLQICVELRIRVFFPDYGLALGSFLGRTFKNLQVVKSWITDTIFIECPTGSQALGLQSQNWINWFTSTGLLLKAVDPKVISYPMLSCSLGLPITSVLYLCYSSLIILVTRAKIISQYWWEYFLCCAIQILQFFFFVKEFKYCSSSNYDWI
jgi:hypothetical protein